MALFRFNGHSMFVPTVWRDPEAKCALNLFDQVPVRYTFFREP